MKANRVYGEPRLKPGAATQLADKCPACGGFLAEETRPNEFGRETAVMFCTNTTCRDLRTGEPWREWWLEGGRGPDVDSLLEQGLTVPEVAARVGVSVRSVYRHRAARRGSR